MQAAHERSELVYRHNRVTRLTHWLSALAFLILLMSGLQIFNAHPNLYWGDTSEPGTAFFSIGALNEDGDIRGYVQLYGRQIDTTGYLGVQQGELAPSIRAFPSWATIPGYYSLADARRWHFFFAWLFALSGFFYVFFNLAAGHLRKIFFTWADARRVSAMIAYYLRLRKISPQEGEYNPLQKMAYTGVLMILAPLILLSGLAMSPQLNVAWHWLPAVFGGRQSARSVHFILTFAFVVFVIAHVFMVLTQGFFNNMRSMTTGWYRHRLPAPAEAPPATAPPEPESANAWRPGEPAGRSQNETPHEPDRNKDEVRQPSGEHSKDPPAASAAVEREGDPDVETKS